MALTGKTIGDVVDIFCSRCRLNLDASVAALADGKVVKVTCRTCNNEVKYRPARDEDAWKKKQLEKVMRMRENRFAGKPKSEMSGPNPLRKMWDDLTDKVDSRRARVYDPTRTYEVEEALLHKQYGMGIIERVDQDGEMNVLFRDGFRALPSQQEPEEPDY